MEKRLGTYTENKTFGNFKALMQLFSLESPETHFSSECGKIFGMKNEWSSVAAAGYR